MQKQLEKLNRGQARAPSPPAARPPAVRPVKLPRQRELQRQCTDDVRQIKDQFDRSPNIYKTTARFPSPYGYSSIAHVPDGLIIDRVSVSDGMAALQQKYASGELGQHLGPTLEHYAFSEARGEWFRLEIRGAPKRREISPLVHRNSSDPASFNQQSNWPSQAPAQNWPAPAAIFDLSQTNNWRGEANDISARQTQMRYVAVAPTWPSPGGYRALADVPSNLVCRKYGNAKDAEADLNSKLMRGQLDQRREYYAYCRGMTWRFDLRHNGW